MSNTTSKIANPGPLGLLGFGMTTVLLNLHNAGLLPLSIVIVAMGNHTITMIAGYEGIFCGLSAMYSAFGQILNEEFGKKVLPLG